MNKREPIAKISFQTWELSDDGITHQMLEETSSYYFTEYEGTYVRARYLKELHDAYVASPGGVRTAEHELEPGELGRITWPSGVIAVVTLEGTRPQLDEALAQIERLEAELAHFRESLQEDSFDVNDLQFAANMFLAATTQDAAQIRATILRAYGMGSAI